jgi:hypothetical protein
MIHVYSDDECNQIINNEEQSESLIQKGKQILVDYFRSNGFYLNDCPVSIIWSYGENGINKGAKLWHFDDVCIVNFIICLNGDGTYIFIDDEIKQIQKGYGYPVVGEEGYAFLGIKPTCHCAPLVASNNRVLLKFIVDGSYDLDKKMGGDVEKYNSEKYNKRKAELCYYDVWKKYMISDVL